MIWFDYVLVVLLALLWPLQAWRGTRKMLRQIAAGELPPPAMSIYREIIATQWTLVAILVVWWFLQSRSLAELGLHLYPPKLAGLLGAGLLTVAWLALSWWEIRALLRSPAAREQVLAQVEDFKFMLPKTAVELRGFRAVAVTAGICEELLYRGFLFWCFVPLAGLWPTIIATSVLFGLVHAYQGIANAPKAALLGLLTALLYWLTGSLWAPIALHVLVDLIAGQVLFNVLNRQSLPAPGEATAG